jgi:hypothetical protein
MDACFIVKDHTGHSVYFEGGPGEPAANLVTRDEARRIAANIASCRNFCSDNSDRSMVRGQPLGCVHQRAGILDRRRRFDLIAARSIGEAVVGDMSVHSVVPVQGIGGACTFFEASVPSTCVGERTPV